MGWRNRRETTSMATLLGVKFLLWVRYPETKYPEAFGIVQSREKRKQTGHSQHRGSRREGEVVERAGDVARDGQE